MIKYNNKQFLILYTIFSVINNLEASTTTTSTKSTTLPSTSSTKSKSSIKKPTGAVKNKAQQMVNTKKIENPLTSNEKNMIEDFINKAHAIPDTKAEKKDYKNFRTALDKAYKAYEKMYYYENYISINGMNVPDALNKDIKEAAKILFNAKHIENMVWQLKKDKKAKQ